MIGGVVSVFSFTDYKKPPADLLCFNPLIYHYKNLLALFYAVDEINKYPWILPNMTLGYHIYDSCADPRKAVKSIIQILSGPGYAVPNYSCTKNKVVGFIGDHFSSTTFPIAQLLGIYPYTQISYGATDVLFNDRDLFPSVFRTLPDDYTTYLIISYFLSLFGWTLVGILAPEDDNGDKEIRTLTNFLTDREICVDFALKSSRENFKDGIERSSRKIKKSSAQIIVICGPLSFALSPIKNPDMENYFKNFHLLKNPKDLIYKELVMRFFGCSSGIEKSDKTYEELYKTSLSKCDGTEPLGDYLLLFSQVNTLQMYLAVQYLAAALHNMDVSQGYQSTDQIHRNRHKVHKYIEDLVCPDESGTERECFTERGDKESGYIINNPIIFGTKIVSWNRVGSYNLTFIDDADFWVHAHDIVWKNAKNETPRSQCSESCLPGQKKVTSSSIHMCCYDCALCSEGEISNKSDSKNCMKCPEDSWPNENGTFCVLKEMEYLSYAEDILSIAFSCLSSFFCILTILIFVLFYYKRDTPIVRANNKNLSFVLLVSIMLSFLCVFLFLGRPVDITCMLRQISAGILFSVSISSLLAKTIMVCIAFKATKPGSVWRTWTGVKLPNSVLLICSSVQVVLCMSWVTLSPPFQELDTHSYKEKTVVQCNEGSDLWFYSVLGYMGILAAISFIIAFLVRTLPDSFNEAKYITFSMLVFCSVWIAMIPAYLSTKGKYMVAVEIFAILTSSAGLLGCIFVTKCYIILFKPELNTRKHLLELKNTVLHH
ncbi:vomeronasal type-2 receptor 26-like [Leptodactylus fuscus]|uniref:vomeronasal type-2 receptor 26-like n=1 Tax=Leptodactylus fuscus TaxID=238119 RepID=UPI003F4F0556